METDFTDTEEERRALTESVDRFADAMKHKLLAKQAEGWEGWSNPAHRTAIRAKLQQHVDRGGQWVDVANLAMFLWVTEYGATPETEFPADAALP